MLATHMLPFFSTNVGKTFSKNTCKPKNITIGHNYVHHLPLTSINQKCKWLINMNPMLATHMLPFFSTNVGKTFPKKLANPRTSLLGIIMYTTFQSQMNSIIFVGQNPLITNNMTSSKKPICVSWSFLNWLKITKNLQMVIGFIIVFFLIGSWSIWPFNG